MAWSGASRRSGKDCSYRICATDTGFDLLRAEELIGGLCWSDIVTVVAYKRDSITSDDVCLEITDSQGREWLLCEWAEQFWDFVNSLERACHIPQTWRDRVLKSPFAENRTVIYSV
jgi:hypothetical protein